jgi:hypothetical protein
MTYNTMLQTYMQGTEHNKPREVLVATQVSEIGNWSTTILDPDTEEELDLTAELARYEPATANIDDLSFNHAYVIAELVQRGYALAEHKIKGIGAIIEFCSKSLPSGQFSDTQVDELELLAQKYDKGELY